MLKIFTILLNPFAPHITEELWETCSFDSKMVAQQQWPQYDEAKCKDTSVEIAVQLNGKLRARITVAADIDKEGALTVAKADAEVASALAFLNSME